MRKNRVLYTMVCSTGSGGDRRTPTGTYSIQAERGETFLMNLLARERTIGYLGKIMASTCFIRCRLTLREITLKKKQKNSGQKANSHGCIRLTVADAKWFYEHALYGMQSYRALSEQANSLTIERSCLIGMNPFW